MNSTSSSKKYSCSNEFLLPLGYTNIRRMDISMKEELLNVKDRSLILFWTDTRYRVLRHLIFSIGFFLFLLSTTFRSDFEIDNPYLAIFIIYCVFMCMFYTNMYLLVPCLFMRGRHVLYLITLFIVVTIEITALALIFRYFFNAAGLENTSIGWWDLVDSAFITILIIFPSTAMKLFQRWASDVAQIAELKQLSNELELNVLKNQINPHFLFNMLNNVKSLIRQNPEMASMVILKLSDFLRHQIYGKGDEKIPFDSEIEFLSNFLDLEKIRRESFQFAIEIRESANGLSATDLELPSNLFTTFVENAIKYSVDPEGRGSYINLVFELGQQQLTFICRNSVSPEALEICGGGLGLVNIQRRLELLYGNRYRLETQMKNQEFMVFLEIKL